MKTAVVLFNLGRPDKQERVKPFLFNLFNDILKCFSESGIELPKSINASGGAAKPVLLQFISSLTNLEICYSYIKDKTAIGVFKIISNGEQL